jgi:hypothetical protein
VSFIQIGSDVEATIFLKDLDDDIPGARLDIVDTVTFIELQGMSFTDFIMKSITD